MGVLLALALIPTTYYIYRQIHRKILYEHNQPIIRAARAHYSEIFKPGANRRDVKNYLKAQGASFSERWPGADGRSKAFAIVVKVAEEDSPWYCNAWLDYVAIEFEPTTTTQTSSLWSLSDSDVVTQILVTSNGEGCL
jgi:hypothetical protein